MLCLLLGLGLPELAMGRLPLRFGIVSRARLGLGLVVEDQPTEFSCSTLFMLTWYRVIYTKNYDTGFKLLSMYLVQFFDCNIIEALMIRLHACYYKWFLNIYYFSVGPSIQAGG